MVGYGNGKMGFKTGQVEKSGGKEGMGWVRQVVLWFLVVSRGRFGSHRTAAWPAALRTSGGSLAA